MTRKLLFAALAALLRAEQRGWVKGRSECMKANGQQTWITATWTVDTVKACVEAQYRLRTPKLMRHSAACSGDGLRYALPRWHLGG